MVRRGEPISCIQAQSQSLTFRVFLNISGNILPSTEIIIKNEFLTLLTNKARKELFYFTTHTIHFIYGYMASDIW